jgi:hypothetical protein
MAMCKTLKTNQGKLEIWEHESQYNNGSSEQKYASRIFNKVTCRSVFKIHSSSQELEIYIESLNINTPIK